MTDDNEKAPANEDRTADTVVGGKTLAEWGAEGGAPKGSQNALGNSGGGAPENNQNGAKHHLRSDPEKLLPWLEEKKPDQFEWVMNKYRSYLDRANFSHGSAMADKLLETVVCEYIVWFNRGTQLKRGIVTETKMKDSDGKVHEVEDERPENLAINRLDRQIMTKLNKMGIFDESEGVVGPETTMKSEDYTIHVESKTVEASDEDQSQDEEAEGGGHDEADDEADDDGEDDHEGEPSE